MHSKTPVQEQLGTLSRTLVTAKNSWKFKIQKSHKKF
jgi:hypothetical protein